MSNQKDKNNKRTRFAIYTRYSSEMQSDLSLEAQEERCRQAIIERDGVVISVFSDGAKSGWSLERNGFLDLRRAAEHGKFDAVMFWKFDRLARNHDHVVMIKMLLRHEYGLKLYCVEGFSEDEDDSPYSAMMEQMLAVFSAFYSKNLSSETKRGKRQRVLNGEFNGSVPPLGYDLVTLIDATEERPAGLHIVPRLAVIVRRAFRMYATGKHSDYTISKWMNSRKEIQNLREGKMPIGKEMVRDMLQNRVYTGHVPYAETLYSGSLGQGKKSSRKRKQWFEGKHKGFISDELFDICQEVRQANARTRRPPEVLHTYILHDRVFCARCTSRKPVTLEDANYGKMRPSWNLKRDQGWYRCIARDRGYLSCDQPLIDTALVDEQVVAELSQLTIPEGFRERVEQAVRSNVENEEALRRMAEIEEAVKRVDFSWEKGFLTPQEYIEKRNQFHRELESLRPVDYDDLIEAADLLENFSNYWEACMTMENYDEARKQLLAKIVERIFIYDDTVIAIALHGDYSVVLDNAGVAPSELVEKIKLETTRGTGETACTPCAQSGSDGIRTRDLWLDRPAC
jgi:DNA invertase Pin-like site-specific DNA recombinase